MARSAKRSNQSLSAFRQRAIELGWIIGLPDECARELSKFKEIGINHIILNFSNGIENLPLELFMDVVVPQLRWQSQAVPQYPTKPLPYSGSRISMSDEVSAPIYPPPSPRKRRVKKQRVKKRK